jgi:site-specific recombinase XerD
VATVTIQKYTGKTKTSYTVRFKDPATGKTKYYKTFQKKKNAQQSANDLRSLIDNGQMKKVVKNRAKREIMTFEKVTESLIMVWRKKLERNKLSPDTFEGYICRANVLNNNNVFGKKLICEIRSEDIAKFQDDEQKRNSPASANRYLFNIKQVFKLAIALGIIVEDPTENIKYLCEKDHERNTFIGPVLIDKLIETSQLTRGKFYMPALILLGAEHGAAKQEALSLIWKDIDFEGKGLIRLYRTKNKKERTEYIMPRTKQALLDWRDHLAYMRHRKRIEVKDTKLVFCHLDGTSLKRFDKAWRRICELAGLDDFHYHDLRHTFCSNLILSGSDLKDVKEMIGHNDLAMTDRYSHLTNRHKQIRQDELDRYYRNGMCYNEVGYK